MSIPKISDAEWEIMKYVWKNHPVKSEEIIAALAIPMNWTDQTIKTFINRLLKKGALGYEKNGRSYTYFPLLTEKECVMAESKSFLERVYDGATVKLFANFLEEELLSDQEIARLQKLLEEKKRS